MEVLILFLSLTPFVIETDYKYFQGLLRRKEEEIPYPQLARWSESLSRFKFEVKHIKGESNIVAYFLSRPTMKISQTWCTKSLKKPLEWYPLPASVKSPPLESSKRLPLRQFEEQFSYNPSEIIEKLHENIKEIIFDKVTDHLTYVANSNDIEWRVWALVDNIHLHLARKVGEKFLYFQLFNP